MFEYHDNMNISLKKFKPDPRVCFNYMHNVIKIHHDELATGSELQAYVLCHKYFLSTLVRIWTLIPTAAFCISFDR